MNKELEEFIDRDWDGWKPRHVAENVANYATSIIEQLQEENRSLSAELHSAYLQASAYRYDDD